jgi:hypothetical protein
MKKLIILIMLAFSMVVFGQEDSREKTNLSVVSADKMNVVYRGLANPISIAVSDGEVSAVSAPGLSKNGKGQYILKPGQGTEVAIMASIKKNDGSIIVEKHIFRIKGIPSPIGLIDGQNCYSCIVCMTKKDLQNAEISIGLPDFTFAIDLKLKSYNVKFSGKKTIVVQGIEKFPSEVLLEINKLKKGDTFDITEIGIDIPNGEGYLFPKTAPIKVMIVDEPIPNYESPEFIKDSLQNMKYEKKLLRKQKI